MMRIGIDTGGTFTDFTVLDGKTWRVHKVPSDPDSPARAILHGLRELGIDLQQAFHLVHGTTVATNAVLERKGARCVYITNRGFADILSLGRQARSELYNLTPPLEEPPVPADLCLETGGRLAFDGEELEPLTEADLDELCRKIEALKPEAVAINFLFSFLDDRHERQIEEALPEGLFVSRSSEVLPEIREYERGMATWLNSYVGPRVGRYINELHQSLPKARLDTMQSHGATLPGQLAARHAVRLLLSGPAGGLAAALQIGRQAGCERILSLDMGGTSTDVALIDGDIKMTSKGKIGGWPVSVPMADMHTIGAGGGSLAYRDSGRLLRVGPHSAGSQPGPACYARGGTEPTVTDANVVLGWLPAQTHLAGDLPLDVEAARSAIDRLAQELELDSHETAQGIVHLVNENMAQALRVVSVRQGHNPKDFVLMAFGGAGGLHLCELADALSMTQAMIPVYAGIFSALGLLLAPQGRELSQTVPGRFRDMDEAEIERRFDTLAERIHEETGGEVLRAWRQTRDLDLRYEGQSEVLRLPWVSIAQTEADFHAHHRECYGYTLDMPVELVNLRLNLRDPTPPPTLPPWTVQEPADPFDHVAVYGLDDPVPVYSRAELAIGQAMKGPAIILEDTATIRVSPNWRVEVDAYGNIRLQREP